MITFPLWLIPLLPLTAAGLILVLPIRRAAFGYIAFFGTLGSAVLALINLLASNSGALRSDLLHVSLAGRYIQTGYVRDPLGSIMALVVSWIATPILLYSIGYMRDEEAHRRFFATLALFTAAMLSLVLAGDYLLLYFSWEVVGFCSYLLIGHNTKEGKSKRAAFKAFLITRIGDLGLLTAIGLILVHVAALDFKHVLSSVSGSPGDASWVAIAVLLLMGAAGKSAQFPLHWWLPDAMAGPTPVSALLHSATMVAAGVYLLARSLPLLEAAPIAHLLMLSLGVITAVAAAVCACVQTDLKRLLAYSTMSQIGEMFIALAIGGTLPGTFHLIAQATFKALLFVAAGIVVKAAGTNDLSKLNARSRTAYIGFLAGALSLSGFPPLAGFWSRGAISRDAHGWISTILLLLSLVSGFYIARAFLLAFAPQPDSKEQTPWVMRMGVYTLLVFTLIAGFLQSPWLDGWLGNFLGKPQPIRLGIESLYEPALAAVGCIRALALYRDHAEWAPTAWWRTLLRSGFGTDYLPSAVAHGFLAFARMLEWIEESIFNRAANGVVGTVLSIASVGAWLDPQAINRSVMSGAEGLGTLGGKVRQIQTGKVYHYLAAAFAWVILIALISLWYRVK